MYLYTIQCIMSILDGCESVDSFWRRKKNSAKNDLARPWLSKKITGEKRRIFMRGKTYVYCRRRVTGGRKMNCIDK